MLQDDLLERVLRMDILDHLLKLNRQHGRERQYTALPPSVTWEVESLDWLGAAQGCMLEDLTRVSMTMHGRVHAAMNGPGCHNLKSAFEELVDNNRARKEEYEEIDRQRTLLNELFEYVGECGCGKELYVARCFFTDRVLRQHNLDEAIARAEQADDEDRVEALEILQGREAPSVDASTAYTDPDGGYVCEACDTGREELGRDNYEQDADECEVCGRGSWMDGPYCPDCVDQ